MSVALEGHKKGVPLTAYYQLVKPGIVYANCMTAAAGFLFASKNEFEFQSFIASIVGIALIIAGSCVLNNVLDRQIDRHMKRTEKRPTVTGEISVTSAIVYGLVLLVIGLSILFLLVNNLVGLLGIIAVIAYVGIYGFFKRRSPFGTVVGAVPGALPIMAGYVSVSGVIDVTAIVLFFILFSWQMPHFYAISIYRQKEYANAGIPVLTVRRTLQYTKIVSGAYLLLFIGAVFMLPIVHKVGLIYDLGMAAIIFYWLYVYVRGIRRQTPRVEIAWARSFFGASLLVLIVFSVLISIDNLLPGMI